MATSKVFITTIGGRSFDPLSPATEDIDIQDIAHSLSLICRANGHFSCFFSVARHCINCAAEAQARGFGARVRLLCLLHDATEAYIGDMTRPLKRQLPYYCECESKLHARILDRFGIPAEDDSESEIVKEIDDCMLYHEFLLFNGDKLYDDAPEVHIEIAHSERDFRQTKAEFLELFEKLMTEAGYQC